jgi:hypothetical protein
LRRNVMDSSSSTTRIRYFFAIAFPPGRRG